MMAISDYICNFAFNIKVKVKLENLCAINIALNVASS